MRSTTHVLELRDGSYVCRSAQNRCELDFVQHAFDEEACTSKSGCVYDPGECYCPLYEGVQCVCAGGPPPMCKLDD